MHSFTHLVNQYLIVFCYQGRDHAVAAYGEFLYWVEVRLILKFNLVHIRRHHALLVVGGLFLNCAACQRSLDVI